MHELAGDVGYPWHVCQPYRERVPQPCPNRLIDRLPWVCARRVGLLGCSPVEPVLVAASSTVGGKAREGVLAAWNLRALGSKV